MAWPCSAERQYQRTAAASSRSTPRPVPYITPRLFWAAGRPWSADRRIHRTASPWSCATSRPSRYRTPRLACPPGCPWSADRRNPPRRRPSRAPGHDLTDDDHGLGVGRSASLTLRPQTISRPARSKNPGWTSTRSAMKAPWSRRRLEPGEVEVDRALAERVLIAPTASTPGRAAKRCKRGPRVDARRVGREPERRRQEGHHGGRLAAEARVAGLHPLKAAEEQAGADEQHQQDRQLRDEQGVAPPELTGLAAPGVLASEGAGMPGRVLCSNGTKASGARPRPRRVKDNRAPPRGGTFTRERTPGIDSQSDSLRSGNRRDCWKSPEAEIGDFLSKTADPDLDGCRWNGQDRTENHGVASSILALGTTLNR